MRAKKYLSFTRQAEVSFRRLTGVKKSTFSLMCEVVKEARKSLPGPDPKLCVGDQVLLWLKYMRDYTTYLATGRYFGVSESAAYKTCVFVEKVLIKSEQFHLAGKGTLLEQKEDQLILIDASESPIQRPKIPVRNRKKIKNRRNKQKRYYSGKKKKHSIKSQIVFNRNTKKIIALKTSTGRKHDFRLFKESKTSLHPQNKVCVDTGYMGIKKIHPNSELPKKSSKNKPLSKEDKKINTGISSKRVPVEHVFAFLKKFHILADKYRNRRKRFHLRLTLISAIFNLESL